MIVMSSDFDSDGEYDSTLSVQLLSVIGLSVYLRNEGFSKADVQDLASESRCMPINFDHHVVWSYKGVRWKIILFVGFVTSFFCLKLLAGVHY